MLNLIDRGRNLLERTFSALLPRGEQEVIVPWQTHFATYGDIAPDGFEKVTAEVGNFVTFSRSIAGVNVVGRGSKVELAFDQEGQFSGMTFDWPKLKRTKLRQQVATKGEVHSLVVQLTSEPMVGSLIDPVETQCGYYDPGTGEREVGELLQLACQVHTIRTSYHEDPSKLLGEALELVAAIEDVVSVGQHMLRSSGWDALYRWLKRKVESLLIKRDCRSWPFLTRAHLKNVGARS